MKLIIDSQQLNQSGENIKIDLQSVIDNRSDEYVILLREISYYVGYFNISDDLGNNRVTYSNGSRTNNVFLPDGLYTLQNYFNVINMFINNSGDNEANIKYNYNDYEGRVIIYVTPPYTFSILHHQINLLGFDTTQIITNYAIAEHPVNFTSHKMLYIHLKQLKNSDIYFNGKKSDILAKVPVTNDKFGTLVTHKFDKLYTMELDNTSINSLELTITDENNSVIDFHNMPVFYVLEICKNLYSNVDSRTKFNLTH